MVFLFYVVPNQTPFSMAVHAHHTLFNPICPSIKNFHHKFYVKHMHTRYILDIRWRCGVFQLKRYSLGNIHWQCNSTLRIYHTLRWAKSHRISFLPRPIKRKNDALHVCLHRKRDHFLVTFSNPFLQRKVESYPARISHLWANIWMWSKHILYFRFDPYQSTYAHCAHNQAHICFIWDVVWYFFFGDPQDSHLHDCRYYSRLIFNLPLKRCFFIYAFFFSSCSIHLWVIKAGNLLFVVQCSSFFSL